MTFGKAAMAEGQQSLTQELDWPLYFGIRRKFSVWEHIIRLSSERFHICRVSDLCGASIRKIKNKQR